jgi:Protein kinase domain/WD40-like Beta Propeller Repeat
MTPGSQIAHYRIVSKLGEGGMGAVYRATDTKLNREVAIKVLPAAFAEDPDRLARFTREAQVLAALNHPNIAAIYGVEERALVLELVEGAEPKGPLTIEEALPLIQQLADALEYAHEKGIVHRDLKPANLKITPQGNLKVLDFGLAKAMTGDTAAASADAANSPTLTMRATMAGVIMGTAAYMSPEQARGQDVDKRADIWSFGVVVHELLTGKQLFDGATVSDTLASVLRQEVDFNPIPARLQKLLRLCLTRDPRQRLRDISAVRLLLEEPAPATHTKPWAWIAIAGIATLAAAFAGFAGYRSAPSEDRPLLRFETDVGFDGLRSTNTSTVLSPDGKRFVFRTRTSAGFVLAMREFGQSSATLLPGTEGAGGHAFFSPDSQWLAFSADGKLKKLSMQGGAPVTLCEAPGITGGTWLDNDRIVTVLNTFDLSLVPAAGGEPKVIATANQAGRGILYRYPQAIPGNRVLATAVPTGQANGDLGEIVTVRIPSGEVRSVLRGGYGARYAPTGHLLFMRQGTLYAVRFDLSSGTTQGNPVPVQEDVAGNPSIGAGRFDFNALGTLAYPSGKPLQAEQPVGVFGPDGKAEFLGRLTATNLRLSPDGQRLAYVTAGDLSVYDIARETSTRLTFDPSAGNRNPVWTPDGKYLVYSTTNDLWWTRSDGAGKPHVLLSGKESPAGWSLSSGEGTHTLRLALNQNTGPTLRVIQILPFDLTDPDQPVAATPQPFLDTAGAFDPAFSPDGHMLAYAISSSTTNGVFVERYFPGKPSGSGGKWQVAPLGRFPVWSRSGKQLFYRAPDGLIMVVDYTTSGDTFSASRPRVWSSRSTYSPGYLVQAYDVFPDGKHAISVLNTDAAGSSNSGAKATFLINFFDELKRKVP